MTTAFTIAAAIVGAVFMAAAVASYKADHELGISAFLAGIGAPVFGAAAFDLITRIA